MKPRFLIRKAEEKDLEAVLSICGEFKETMLQNDIHYYKEFLENCYAFYVTETDGNVIGCVNALDETTPSINKVYGELYTWFKEKLGKFIYVEQIAVSKEYQKQGIGSALLMKIIETSKTKPVCLDALLSNEQGILFYKKMGFEQIGILKLNPKWIYAMLAREP